MLIQPRVDEVAEGVEEGLDVEEVGVMEVDEGEADFAVAVDVAEDFAVVDGVDIIHTIDIAS